MLGERAVRHRAAGALGRDRDGGCAPTPPAAPAVPWGPVGPVWPIAAAPVAPTVPVPAGPVGPVAPAGRFGMHLRARVWHLSAALLQCAAETWVGYTLPYTLTPIPDRSTDPDSAFHCTASERALHACPTQLTSTPRSQQRGALQEQLEHGQLGRTQHAAGVASDSGQAATTTIRPLKSSRLWGARGRLSGAHVEPLLT